MISLSPERLKRYKEILMVILKHRKSSFKNLNSDAESENNSNEFDKPEEFTKDLEELGPTFIKLGQLLSSRPDFLPMPYIDALSRLQDKVKPFPFEEAEQIINDELGVRISKVFQEFTHEPIAAASLGQVHKAILRDGRLVAVKIQRPNIKSQIIKDLDALEDITHSVDKYTETGKRYSFTTALEEFRKTILLELDYVQEAQNMIKLRENLKEYERIVIPQPIPDFSTSKVLTMDYIRGKKINMISPLARLDIDGTVLAEDLFKSYLDQILVDGFFHADPHPGNVFITNDYKLALIDLGMVARIDPVVRENLIKLLLFIGDGFGTNAANVSLELSTAFEDADKENFIREIKDFVLRYQDSKLEQINVGRVVIQLTRIASGNGFKTAPELTMLGKTLLNLDEIGRILEPEFDPNLVIRKHAEKLLQNHLFKDFSRGNIYSSLLESKEFIQKLPSRLNNILDSVADNKFQLKIDAFDELKLVENFQKVANRISMGLVLAALIVGAALLMQVDSAFKILGYPGLAIILFLLAAGFGFAMIINIMLHDEKRGKHKLKKSR